MTAIEFNHVGKQYRLGLVSTGTLSHDLNRWWQTAILGKEDPYLKIGDVNDRSAKADSDYVWALRDIDFRVEEGDVVGIIGKNGAGKSTLLKLLSKVTAPTTGTIRAKGRIASLLEVGTGFHGEMTGRENIYMNGAILGMTKAEIDRKLDEIVDFSGCEKYIDTPVKRYSSGMTVRLGFAVAAFLDPEILVVDEVLAVGDAEFQKKAIGKMKDVSQGQGRTVLFVSHNMDSIVNLCTRGVLLENGMVNYIGDVHTCVDLYTKINSAISEYNNEGANKSLYIKSFYCIDESDKKKEIPMFMFSDHPQFHVSVNWDGAESLQNAVLDVSIYTQRNIFLCSMEYPLTKELFKNGTADFSLKLPSELLSPSSYYVQCAVHVPNVKICDFVKEACSFVIQDTNTQYLKYSTGNHAMILIKPEWTVG